MDTSSNHDPPISLEGVHFNQKWELLRPAIERLYIHENLKLSDVVQSIRDRYAFDANESQYKYQIKKWKLKKSTSTSKKVALYHVIQKRAELGKSSTVTRAGQYVDTKNLRRYLKTEARKAITLRPDAGGVIGEADLLAARIAQFGNRIFMNWTMPYGATRLPVATGTDHNSPLSDVLVATPPSPGTAPSPTAVAVKTMTSIDRTRLFAQGRHNDLFKSLGMQHRVTMSTWMYQFWLFSFKTAKHWGRAPRHWTADILGFHDYHQQTTIVTSSSNTPGTNGGTPATQPSPGRHELTASINHTAADRPSSLCRWSIHCRPMIYVKIRSPAPSSPRDLDLGDEADWPDWPSTSGSDFTEILSSSLQSNSFSTVQRSDLPIKVDQVARAAQRLPEEFREEALGFAIMSGNTELVGDLLEKRPRNLDSTLHPLHLAVSYINGAKDCCLVLNSIQEHHPPLVRKSYVNDLGHTILDQIMIAILKNHTSCSPGVVDPVFKKEKRFEGEDIDICGRWDADSDCVRSLLAKGIKGIPFEWKHVFCHTSVQALCHCIGAIFGPHWGPDINLPSGLFITRCSHCGLKMELLPLHTLVLVGLHLSQSGCEGETLFGLLACLLCLLRNGANPLLKADMSLLALLGSGSSDRCNHKEMDPVELMEEIPSSMSLEWSQKLRTGWNVFRNVLKHSHALSRTKSPPVPGSISSEIDEYFDTYIDYSDSSDSSNDYRSINEEICEGFHQRCFKKSKILAPLWAAVQTELLTYRRLEEGQEWISTNFDMNALGRSLSERTKIAIPLMDKNMMKPFCSCGDFGEAELACPVNEEATTSYFSNLEDWNRSSFIGIPEDRYGSWSRY